jgi:hypothetical protein
MNQLIPTLQELCIEEYNELLNEVDIEGIIYQRKKRIIYSVVLLCSSKFFTLNNKSIEKIKEESFEELKFESNYDCDVFGICELIDLIEMIKDEFDSIETERIFNPREFILKLNINDDLFKFSIELNFELNEQNNDSFNFFENIELAIIYLKD